MADPESETETETETETAPDRGTPGERAADLVRNGLGSWTFVAIFVALMAVWAIFNTIVLRHDAFDPYPYILLNLFLSMLAGLQGAILLIAARRADQISAETAAHTLANTEKLKKLIERNTELTEKAEGLTEQIEQLASRMNEHLDRFD